MSQYLWMRQLIRKKELSRKKKTVKKAAKMFRKLDKKTKPEDILDTFQKQNLAPEEVEPLADQLLQRGVQKAADKIGLR